MSRFPFEVSRLKQAIRNILGHLFLNHNFRSVKGVYMKEQKQLASERISVCSPLASFIRAEEIAPIGQLQFEDTMMDVEG